MSFTSSLRRDLVRGRGWRTALFETVLIAFVLVYLFPFYIMVTQALKTTLETLYNPLSLPSRLNLDNLFRVWDMMKFQQAFTNTFILTAISVIGIALISAMCAFPLARKRSPGYTLLYYVLICGLLIPPYMTLSPLIKLMKDIGFMDSLLGVSVSYLGRGVPFAVFLYVGFIRSIPNEIIEAGIIDGCSPLQLFWHVLFPMLRPVTITLIILNSLWTWNDFLFPLLTLQSGANRTLTLAQYVFHGMYASQWNLAFASYLLSMLPLVILYFLLQRYIIAGVTAGAVKS